MLSSFYLRNSTSSLRPQLLITKILSIRNIGTESKKRACYCEDLTKSKLPGFNTNSECVCISDFQLADLRNRVSTALDQRALGRLRDQTPSTCMHSNSFIFKDSDSFGIDCSLIDIINKVFAYKIYRSGEERKMLPPFTDVSFVGNKKIVFLEALSQAPPQGASGNQTGDYGIEMVNFLRACHSKGYLREIKSIFDVGGQNTQTIDRINEMLQRSHHPLPGVILDLNLIVPALAPLQQHIKYIIGDAEDFFSLDLEGYKKHIYAQSSPEATPVLYLLNNFLNVLSPEKGWNILRHLWDKLEPGDYLAISGLDAEHLKNNSRCIQNSIEAGIAEFYEMNQSFYKNQHTLHLDQQQRYEKEEALCNVQQQLYINQGYEEQRRFCESQQRLRKSLQAFHKNRQADCKLPQFYKSGLTDNFFHIIKRNLNNVTICSQEKFSFNIQWSGSKRFVKVHGIRGLLKKEYVSQDKIEKKAS